MDGCGKLGRMPPRPSSPSLFAAPLPPQTHRTSQDKQGWLHAHCDGGARGNPGPAGYGALLQDDSGATVAELSEYLGHRTNNFAEYNGLLGCLQYAIDHGHRRLKVISDSELMVKQIQGKYQVKSPDLKPLFEEARRRIAQLDAFEISHALRHKNKDADRLANEAMDRGSASSPAKRPDHSTERPDSLHPTSVPIAERLPAVFASKPAADAMLRGFTRDGVVHILGGATLPDNIFVKIIRE